MMFSLVIIVALVVGCVIVAGFIMGFAAFASKSSDNQSDHEKR